MKKFFIAGLAVLFCLSLAGPAMAELKMGGSISVDFGYISYDDDASGVGESINQVEFVNDKIFTRWNGRYESEDGKLVGMIEIRGGASTQVYNPVTMQTSYSDDINWSYAYIVWRPVKNQSFQIGYQTMLFADAAPGPYPLVVAFTRGRTATGYGEYNHAARIVSFRWMTRFSDAIRFEAAASVPGNSGGFGDFQDGGNLVGLGPDAPFGTFREEDVLPRLDVKVPMYFGGSRICFAGTYGQQTYKSLGGNLDPTQSPVNEGFNVYGISGNINWPIGIFSITAEAFWGQNLGASSWGGAMGPNANYAQPVWNPSTQSFEDATTYAGWISLSVKLGPGSLGGYFSYIQDEVEGNIAGLGNIKRENARNSFGFNYVWPLGKGFIMRPVINFYDDGEEKVSGAVTQETTRGKIMNAGINFQLSF
jgi:hypothetical protein